MTETPGRQCPRCGSRNHPSSRFCVGCGALLEAGRADATLQPSAPPEEPSDETVALVARLAERCGRPVETTPFGFRVKIDLGDDRQQSVHVGFGGQDDAGRDLVTLLSVCGRADDRTAQVLLKRNARIVAGHFAIRTLAGEEHFVVVANRVAGGPGLEDIGDLISKLAREADLVESQLTAGADVY
jgi:hypothetical protein